ncbi:MAG: tetratricopeptide repeat protein [Chloroflexi bacterium]|nr:tetratricopeptide repeat protein [Chloroflexota bacterium]
METLEAPKRAERARIDVLAADVGQRIRAARQERGMSLAQLGGQDLSRSFLSLVELGRSRISLRALTIVAERLGLPVSYFLEGAPGSSDGSVELTLNRAEAALAQQEPAEALRLLAEAEGSETLYPRTLLLRGRALIDSGQPRDAIAVLQEGRALARRRGEASLQTQFIYTIGLALYSTRNYDEALVYLRDALDQTVDGAGDPALRGKISTCIGHIQFVRGDVDSAIEHYIRARDLFGSVTDLHTLGRIYSELSRAYKQKGDLSGALRYSGMSVAAFEANNNARLVALELNNLAARYKEMGTLDQALKCGQEAVAHARQINAADIEAAAHSTLASIYLQQEKIDAATSEARAADALARDDTDLARVDAWIVLAEIEERQGNRDRADELYRRSLETLERAGRQTTYADAALGYSLLLRRRNDTAQALDYAIRAAQAKLARPLEGQRR